MEHRIKTNSKLVVKKLLERTAALNHQKMKGIILLTRF